MLRIRVEIVLVLLTTCLLSGSITVAGPDSSRVALLETNGYWRTFLTFLPPVAQDGKTAQPLTTFSGSTALPAKEWTQAGFDDQAWYRAPGPHTYSIGAWQAPDEMYDAGFTYYDKSSTAVGLISMRGKFQVDDPALVKDIKLSVAYRGGLVVYLNGKELGRYNVGKGDGTLPADVYSDDAFFTPDDKLLGYDPKDAKSPNLTELKRRWKLHVRSAELAIPAESLQRGANVLALEIHRAPFPKKLVDQIFGKASQVPQAYYVWSTCGFVSATLDAASAARTESNLVRPAGLRVWNCSTLAPVWNMDFSGRSEALQPMRLVAPLNGVASDQVVVSSTQSIKNLKVTVSDLTLTGGAGKIPVSAVKVRYALPTGWEPGLNRYPVVGSSFDGLTETPPGEVPVTTASKNIRAHAPTGPWPLGATQPVWVTVQVPASATAGEYRGKLMLTAADATEVEVPIELSVAPWKAPAPSQYTTVVDVMQSPESVALQYGVEPYSDQHFKLLKKSLELLGYVGNWTVYIPLICQTNQGNEQSMVRWIKQSDDSYKQDFSVMEKYLDLVEQHMGKPRAVIIYAWDMAQGGTRIKQPNETRTEGDTYYGLPAKVEPGEVPVTGIDPATGKTQMIQLPPYTNPASVKLWKPVADELRQRLAKRGLDQAMYVGMASDCAPTREIVEILGQIYPGATWARSGHFEWSRMGTTDVKPGWQADVVPISYANLQAGKPSLLGWKRPDLRVLYPRTGDAAFTAVFWKLLPELTTTGAVRGFGRVGLDYWPVHKGTAPKNPNDPYAGGTLIGRFPATTWRQIDAMIYAIAAAGPDGALGTGKLEAIREGLQENEARLLIEKAVNDPALKTRLGNDLAARCEKILAERTLIMMPLLERQQLAGFFDPAKRPTMINGSEDGFMFKGDIPTIYNQWYPTTDWQGLALRTYQIAGEVAEKCR